LLFFSQLHQLHVNRAHKRLARMTRAADGFSTEQAAEALHKRLAELGLDADEFVRRYNRPPKHSGKRDDEDLDPSGVYADPGPTEVAGDSGATETGAADPGPTEVVVDSGVEVFARDGPATVTVVITLTGSPVAAPTDPVVAADLPTITLTPAAPGPTDPAAAVADPNGASQTADVGQVLPTDAPTTTTGAAAQTDVSAPAQTGEVGGPAAQEAAQNGGIVIADVPSGAAASNSLGLQVECVSPSFFSFSLSNAF
jgi:hypothetical protein